MPVLFLSHSGIDTDAARALKRRILDAAPPGLEVWFDKDDLEPGRPWQKQIEEAIGRSSGFAVYVGSRGVVNWVEAEVRLALERATVEPEYRFIPILAKAAPDPQALPGFARQFQCVVEDQFEELLAAILRGDRAGRPELETEPFFGLRAIDESRSHLFFGREQETEELVGRVFERPFVLVSGDSGSGKSSLVRSGLVPKFRGGALALLRGERPDDWIWHVVVTRPRGRPWAELGDAVDAAAKTFGISVADRSTLVDWASSGDPDKARRALRCGLPAERTSVLLIVDQFEELFTATPEVERARFVTFLLALVDSGDERFRIVLTLRHDYVNLCNSFDDLRQQLDADHRRARVLLGRMGDAGLERIVTEPLRLAGVDESNRDLLARAIREEVGSRPGDLALVQMALTETWRARHEHGGNLLAAYAAVGRVEGSLAKAAEDVRENQLRTAARAGLAPLLDAVLVRLVRLGDTGGATRRQASRDEFDELRWQLVQLLASEEGKRLVLLGGSDEEPTVEIAHEALVTAWPHFQNLLQSVAEDKRVLDALIPRAKAWAAAPPDERRRRLVSGVELDWFGRIGRERSAWLSSVERRFIAESQAEASRQRARERWLLWGSSAAATVLAALLVFAIWQYVRARGALDRGNRAMAASLWNRLDFRTGEIIEPDELNALWEIRLAGPGFREASVRELTEDPERAIRLGREPTLILRAMYLRWPEERLKSVFGSVTQALARTTDPPQVWALGSSASELAGQFKEEQARQELPRLLNTIAATTDPFQLRAFAWVVAYMRGEPTAEQVQAVVGPVLKALGDLKNQANSSPTIGSSLQMAESSVLTLPREPTLEQAQAAFAPVLTAIGDVDDQANALQALASAVEVLAGKLKPEQAQTALAPILKAIAGTADFRELQQLQSAAQALTERLTGDQARDVLVPLLGEIGGPNGPANPSSATTYATVVHALAGRLSPQQAQAVFAPTSKAIASSTKIPELLVLGAAADGMASKLTPEQARVELAPVLKAIGNARDPFQLQALARVLQALPTDLTPEQSASALTPVLKALAATNDPIEPEYLVSAVQALAGRLTAGQAQMAFTAVLNTVGGQGGPGSPQIVARALGPTLQALAEHLTAEQAQAALAPVLRAMTATTSPYSPVIQSLGPTMVTLAGKLPLDQAAAMLSPTIRGNPDQIKRLAGAVTDPVLQSEASATLQKQLWAVRALSGPLPVDKTQLVFAVAWQWVQVLTDPSQVEVLGPALRVLAGKLPAVQAQAALAPALKAMASATTPVQQEMLALVVEVLADRLTLDQRQVAAGEMRSMLAWSQTQASSVAAAGAMAALVPRDSPERFVAVIVDVLKYPTAAGATTGVLLQALQKTVPGAPGRDAGLDANLDWVAQTYPSIDLDAPPICPPPRRLGFACPRSDR